MGIEELLSSKRADIYRVARRHGVSRVRVYGDVARGVAGPLSDIYFLVEAENGVSPWFPASLIVDLEDLLGRPGQVHVAEPDALDARFRDDVIGEAVEL